MAIHPPAAEHTVHVRGINLHYLEWGSTSSPTMVLHHGFRSISHVWHEVADYFRDRFHIVALDARGHGLSDWDPQHKYDIPTFAKDLDAFVEALNLPPFALIGHSMGAAVVLQYAAEHPGRVTKLVMEDGASAPPGNSRITTTPLNFPSWSEAEAFQMKIMASRRLPHDVVGRELRRLFKETPSGVEWLDDVEPLSADVPGLGEDRVMELTAQLTCPTLLIQAGINPVLQTSTILGMMRRNSRVQTVQIPGSTHDVHRSQLQPYLTEVDRFL